MQDIFARRHVCPVRYQPVYSTSSHSLPFTIHVAQDLNCRPHSLPHCLQGHIYQSLDKLRGRQHSCTRARGRNGGKHDRKEDATPCIKFCLRLLMRSAQAMSFSLFPFPRLPFKPFLLIPQCSDLQSKFKSALNQQARTCRLMIT